MDDANGHPEHVPSIDELLAVLRTAPEQYLRLDADGRILGWFGAERGVLGPGPGLTGLRVDQTALGLADSLMDAVRVALRTGTALSFEGNVQGPEGWQPLGVRLVPVGAGRAVLAVRDLRTAAEARPDDRAEFETLMSAILETEVLERRKAEEALKAARAQEAAIGSRIQRMLLSGKAPKTVAGAQFACLSEPSQHVDGDFTDFVVTDGAVDVLVGDVMGKGIPAALMGAATKHQFLRAIASLLFGEGGVLPQPEVTVELVHRSLTPQFVRLESFVTVFLARLDLAARRLAFVNGGHTRTLHRVAATGEVRLLEGDNLPLGVRTAEVYRQVDTCFGPGDVFVCYSDGLTEARSADGAMFGEEGLAELVAREGWRFPQHLLARIQEGVTAHTGAGALADDLTCVVVRIDDDPGEPLRQAGIAVDSRLESLARVRAFLRDLLADGPGGPVDDDGIDAIELAVDEAVSNVIKHALHGRPDRTIRVELAVFADRVRAQIVHDGQPLDPDLVAPPSFDGTRDNGFGVFLIDQAMDEVRYLRDPDGRSRVVLGRQRQRG